MTDRAPGGGGRDGDHAGPGRGMHARGRGSAAGLYLSIILFVLAVLSVIHLPIFIFISLCILYISGFTPSVRGV